MDAVPGLPTYFVFTPTQTTAEYREKLSDYDEYNIPKDPEDPESPLLWEEYNYELACAELCGSSHFAMRRIVRIVSEEEYEEWLASAEFILSVEYSRVVMMIRSKTRSSMWRSHREEKTLSLRLKA